MWTQVVTTYKNFMILRAFAYFSFLKLGLEFLYYNTKHELPIWNFELCNKVLIKIKYISEHLLLNQRIFMC